ncbi:hypothetical protein HPP92_005542 [Vanilla planifolia]|uniref:Myb/SANT-like DNA-binding domain-containing protein n=1 Tax=Vanilla planifolia TaxID=51239 RepID=A0A835V961_VANPL|nr:hypothetical protein HPP92_005542 [Vanilla planifolia]
MDDTEDDAGYPPNHDSETHRRLLPTPNHSKMLSRNNSYPSQLLRGRVEDHGEEHDGDEEVRPNGGDQAMNNAEDEEDVAEDNPNRGYAREGSELESDEYEDDGDDSSESRGKRRRLDRYTGGFELVHRLAPSPSLKPPPPRSSSAEWSEGATFALLDAWGDLYLQNGRKSLRSDEWGEVAKRVCQGSKVSSSEAQCRNRLDTLKKKFKKEKAKHPDYTGSFSKWVYFQKMDELMSSPSPPPPAPWHDPQLPRLHCGMDAGEYVFANSGLYPNHSNGMNELGDSPGDSASEEEAEGVDDDSDGLPPLRDKVGGSSGASFRMLADSIQKFGKVYEKIENSKSQQMAELERMRKEFHKDLELQKKEILDMAQAEIARLRQEVGEEGLRTDEDVNDDDDDVDDTDVSTENFSGFLISSLFQLATFRSVQRPWHIDLAT